MSGYHVASWEAHLPALVALLESIFTKLAKLCWPPDTHIGHAAISVGKMNIFVIPIPGLLWALVHYQVPFRKPCLIPIQKGGEVAALYTSTCLSSTMTQSVPVKCSFFNQQCE